MNIFRCVFVIVGTIIGAGFASGKEIFSFFFVYGYYGLLGIFLSCFCIFLVIYKSLFLIRKYDIVCYEDFLHVIIGNSFFRKFNIEKVFNLIINIFLLITFFVMCAGFSAYFKQEFGVNEFLSSIIISVFCYFILNKSINGIVFINSILIPLVIVILALLGVKSINSTHYIYESNNSFIWIFMALLYASYNCVTLISVLIPIKNFLKSHLDIVMVSLYSIIVICLLALIIFVLLLSIKGDISFIELPAVYASSSFGYVFKFLYGIIILASIVTTALSSAFGFLNNFSYDRDKYIIFNRCICSCSIFAPLIGFSNLVNNLYPIFGFLGLLQLFFILKCK